MHHQHPFPSLSSIPGMQGSSGVMVNGVVEVSQNVTINEPLWVFGVIKPLAGVTVTINGPMVTGSGQIFDLSAGGMIAGTPEIERVLPSWWGADPNGVEDSSPAINQAIAFCNNDYKPRVEFLAGNYKCMSPIIKHQSFHCPIISGVGGGSSSTADGAGTVFDFSGAVLAENQPCVMIKGGSGRHTHGGIRDIQIIGNGTSTGLQFNDQCGAYAQNLTLTNHGIGIEFYNEYGFAEWNKAIGCQVHNPLTYAYRFRRGAGGTNSFHGCEILDCWANIPPSCKAAVRVESGCNWYNGTARIRVFFTTNGLTDFQDVISVDAGAYDVNLDGYIKTEGGQGWGRMASGRPVNFAGPVLAAGGVTWGSLNPVHYALGIGPEGLGANGVIAMWRQPVSYGPQAITVDPVTGEWDTGMSCAGSYDCEIIVAGRYYEYRISGIAKGNGYGQAGAWFPTATWAMNNQTGWGPPVITINKNHKMIITNLKYPPGEAKFTIWHQQRSLSAQTYLRFATMNP